MRQWTEKQRTKKIIEYLENDDIEFLILDRQLDEIHHELPKGCTIAQNRAIWKKGEVSDRFYLITRKHGNKLCP